MKVTTLLSLFPLAALAKDLLSVAFFAKEKTDLLHFVSENSHIDYGCRPVVVPTKNEHKLHALLTQEQVEHYKRSLDVESIRIESFDHLNKRQNPTAPIGKGDRFQGGKIAPRGLGSQKPDMYGAYKSAGILNADEVYTALKGLEKEYGLKLFEAPYKTFEGNTVWGGAAHTVAKIQNNLQYIYFTSGLHARERGGPDNLIYFIADLLYANKHYTSLTYGKKTYTNPEVKKALSAGIVFIPMTNPDGVRYDQLSNTLWRKNRNPASSIPSNPNSIGVDLNRNFDFLWNFTKHFDPSVSPASKNPASEMFYGTGPFSEPETRNMKWVYDVFPKIRWFVDVHSHAGTMLYSWGDDNNQCYDPEQSQFNPAYDGKRGVVNDTLYGEYIKEKDWNDIKLQANLTVTAMTAVAGTKYSQKQAVGYYPTSGSSDDYASSRWYGNKKLNKVHGFTLEFGASKSFYPTAEEYVQNILDTNAGFMEFILNAYKIGLTG